MTKEVPPEKEPQTILASDIGDLSDILAETPSIELQKEQSGSITHLISSLTVNIEKKGTFYLSDSLVDTKFKIMKETADAQDIETGITLQYLENGNYVTRFEFDYRNDVQKKLKVTGNKGSDEYTECCAKATENHILRFLDRYIKYTAV